MIICPYRLIAVALLLGFVDAGAVRTGLSGAAYAHEGHQSFAAGEPGDPQKPARTIKVVMREDGRKWHSSLRWSHCTRANRSASF
jgi:hypothetical protein